MPPPLNSDELRRRLEDPTFTLVDVMPRESYDARHLPGAVHLALETLEENAVRVLPDTSADIGVYCSGPD